MPFGEIFSICLLTNFENCNKMGHVFGCVFAQTFHKCFCNMPIGTAVSAM